MVHLTSANRRAEDIGILPIVVAELEFRDVQRQIFVAYLVERADNATLEQRPETLDCVCVDRADYVLLDLVMYGLARIFLQARIDLMFVGRQQANFVGNGFAHKRFDVLSVYFVQHARDYVALALYRADYRRLARTRAAAHAVVALIPMAIVVLSADPRFVNLDDTAQLFLRLDHRRADFVGHIQRSFVRAKAHLPLN